MNNNRRKDIKQIIALLQHTYDQLERIKDDEEYSFDNRPENLQYSRSGEESQDAIGAMEEALDKIDEAIGELQMI